MKLRPIEIPIGPSIAIVPLTKGQSALIDASDIPLIRDRNWHASFSPTSRSFYAKGGKRVGEIGPRAYYIHRKILGVSPPIEVDHKNGDSLDNRKANLRLANRSQNAMNQKLNKNNSSGYKGVTWYKTANKFMAYITVNYKRIHLGCFDCPEEARAAYVAAAQKYAGEFARAA